MNERIYSILITLKETGLRCTSSRQDQRLVMLPIKNLFRTFKPGGVSHLPKAT
jgi:hypothetical protein